MADNGDDFRHKHRNTGFNDSFDTTTTRSRELSRNTSDTQITTRSDRAPRELNQNINVRRTLDQLQSELNRDHQLGDALDGIELSDHLTEQRDYYLSLYESEDLLPRPFNVIFEENPNFDIEDHHMDVDMAHAIVKPPELTERQTTILNEISQLRIENPNLQLNAEQTAAVEANALILTYKKAIEDAAAANAAAIAAEAAKREAEAKALADAGNVGTQQVPTFFQQYPPPQISRNAYPPGGGARQRTFNTFNTHGSRGRQQQQYQNQPSLEDVASLMYQNAQVQAQTQNQFADIRGILENIAEGFEGEANAPGGAGGGGGGGDPGGNDPPGGPNAHGGQGGGRRRNLAPTPLRPPKIDSNTFPAFHLPKDETQYLDAHSLWSTQVLNIILANPAMQSLPQASKNAGIMGSLKGSALAMCQHLVPWDYLTSTEMIKAIGDATCGGAIQEKANNLFLSRAQKQNEDIAQYCCSLEMLYNRAFNTGERSFLTFYRQFLAGLQNREVAKAIAEKDFRPENIDDLRHVAIEVEEKKNYFKQSNAMHSVLTKGGKVINAYTPPSLSNSSNYRGEPMEIGAVNKPKNQARNPPKGNSNSQPRKANVSNANSGSLNKNKPKSSPNSNSKPKIICHNCGVDGHISPKCTKPRNPNSPFRPKGIQKKAVFSANVKGEENVSEDDIWPSGSEVNTAVLEGSLSHTLNC